MRRSVIRRPQQGGANAHPAEKAYRVRRDDAIVAPLRFARVWWRGGDTGSEKDADEHPAILADLQVLHKASSAVRKAR